ncbi:RNA-directed DNA polymerase, eukaryota [Tanacetum coccineum]
MGRVKQIASKWGEILDTEDQEEDGFYTKRLCIYSKLGNNIYENFKVIFRGKVFVLRAKEIPGWVPEFADEFDDDDESEEGSKGTKVGGNMSRVQAWTEIIDKVLRRDIINESGSEKIKIGSGPLEGSGEFSVASIQRFIDDQRLLTVDSKTLWIKSVPIKVNILAWKIKLEALPTRFNISRRGIEIDSILCPL